MQKMKGLTERWKEQLKHIVADCKTELQRKDALVRFGEMHWQEDSFSSSTLPQEEGREDDAAPK